MKWLTVLVVSTTVGAFAFVGGYCTRTALAQQNSSAAPNAERLPPDIYPETLNRVLGQPGMNLRPTKTKQPLTMLLLVAQGRMSDGMESDSIVPACTLSPGL
jgi:hypothetical protein